MTTLKHPLLYCNGDSYSNPNYDKSLKNKTYDYIVGKKLNAYNINSAVNGSCNRRIIRTTVADLIHQRELNPKQRIIALIGLSYDLRSEYWNNDFLKPNEDNKSLFESDFVSYQFANNNNWFRDLLNNKTINNYKFREGKNYSKKFDDIKNKSRAFFYNPQAERINLYCDLVMFKELMDKLKVEFLVFNSASYDEDIASDTTFDLFRNEIYKDERFIDLDKFSFCKFAFDNNLEPIDSKDNPLIGHPSSIAHERFAKDILIPKLYQS